MFVSHVLRQLADGPKVALDLCASPGGKSTAMLGALPPGSVLFCNEPIRSRAHVLAENLSKYGHPDVVVTNNYPKDYERSGLMFDLILTDVPCSGEGMFRKDEGAIEEWSLQHVRQCHLLQREIVGSAWKCLRPGGVLIYSTCTFNREENEDNLLWMKEELGAEPQEIAIDPTWGIQGSMVEGCTLPCYRFLPGFTKGEGLFMAVVRKGEDANPPRTFRPPSRSSQHPPRLSQKEGAKALEWIEKGEEYEGRWHGDTLFALPKRWASWVNKSPLGIMQAGVALGTSKGKDFVPDSRLALSLALRKDAFANVSLDYGQAIRYLQREALTLEGAPRGIVLLTYQDLPLGFAKNLGNRANNLYPNEWRIRSKEKFY